MQHPCSRCGAAVDDSSPFCPACEAPQISFTPRDPTVSGSVRLHSETVPPATTAIGPRGSTTYHAAALREQPRFLRAATYAGAIGALLCIIPGGVLLGIPLSGILAVRFYRRAGSPVDVPPRLGFRLGALAGLFASGIFAVVRLISLTNPTAWAEFAGELADRVHRAEAANPDPQIRLVFEYFLTRQGTMVVLVAGIVFTCVVFLVVSGAVGLISAAISRRARAK